MILPLVSIASAGPLIINGEDADTADYPMAGALLVDATATNGDETVSRVWVICSSTLIAPEVVLLAAHCIDDVAIAGGWGTIERMVFGWTRQADLSRWDGFHGKTAWPADAVTVRATVAHEDYSLYQMANGLHENHDIALLFLEQALDTPIAYLPSKDEALQIEEGLTVEIVGWGQQTSGFGKPAAGTFAVKQMGQSFIARLAPYEMQIGLEKSDVRKCHGDSGGPTFLDIETSTDDAMRLIGVTSHAYDASDCAQTGGVDTRVDYYLDWIDAQMRAACEDGTRVWCEVPGILVPPTSAPPMGTGVDVRSEGDGEKVGTGCGCGWTGASPLAAMFAGLLALRRRVNGSPAGTDSVRAQIPSRVGAGARTRNRR